MPVVPMDKPLVYGFTGTRVDIKE